MVLLQCTPSSGIGVNEGLSIQYGRPKKTGEVTHALDHNSSQTVSYEDDGTFRRLPFVSKLTSIRSEAGEAPTPVNIRFRHRSDISVRA